MNYTWMLAQCFGPEWERLSHTDQKLITADFAELLREEYDVPDSTMSDVVTRENARDASHEYRRRIGGGNLASYVAILAGKK